jgi:hypothetical protein
MQYLKYLIYKYKEIYNKVNPSMMASSLTFYFLIVLIPLISLFRIDENKIKLELSFIILLFNIIYSVSKIVYVFEKFINIVYKNIINNFKIRLKAIIIIISFLLLLFLKNIIIAYMEYFCRYLLKLNVLVTTFITSSCIMIFIAVVIILFFKVIIPKKMKLFQIISLVMIYSIISIIFTKLSFQIINFKNINIFDNFSLFCSLIILIYFLFNILINIIIIENMMYNDK